MMTSDQARKLLRLVEDKPNHEKIIAACNKLLRRYPQVDFPEKNANILTARDHLLNPEIKIDELFFAENVDISEMKLKPIQTKQQIDRDTQCLQDMLRPGIATTIGIDQSWSPEF